MTRVEGGSSEQQSLLREIVSRVDSRGISRLVVHSHELSVDGDPTLEGPVGTGLMCDVADDLRAQWNVELIGEAFVRESRRRSLPAVIWLRTREWGRSMTYTPSPVRPLSADDLTAMRSHIAASVGEGSLAHFEILQPLGHAIAITVLVDEPHAYLRHASRTLLTAVSEWRERCDGIYTEIRDEQPLPPLAAAWRRMGGSSSTRLDVQCCAPQLSMSVPIGWEPPACPVFD
jgi:hypothetical protein